MNILLMFSFIIAALKFSIDDPFRVAPSGFLRAPMLSSSELGALGGSGGLEISEVQLAFSPLESRLILHVCESCACRPFEAPRTTSPK
jgi:hypothetical protein